MKVSSMMSRHKTSLLILLLLCSMLSACDSPEEKEAKYIGRGNALFEKGQYDKAKLEYKNAARINPTSAEVRYHLGMIEEAQGHMRDAFIAFRAAEQQEATFHPALLKLAQYYLAAGQLEETKNRLDKVLLQDPDNAQAHAINAALMMHSDKISGAENEARLALSKDPTNVTAFSVLVHYYETTGHREKAMATIQEALARSPNELSLYLLKAFLAEKANDLNVLVDAYKGIFRLKPQGVRFREDLANILVKAGNLQKAENVLRQGVSTVPANKDMKRALLSFLDNNKGLEAAEKEIKRNVISLSKEDQTFWLADLYLKHKDIDRAVVLLEQLVKDGDEDQASIAEAQTSLARIHLVRGDKIIAMKLAALVLENNPNNKDALLLRARLAFENGLYQKAVTDLRTIIRDNPTAVTAQQLLAETLFIQGHLNLAIDTLGQLMAQQPSLSDVEIRLAQFLSQRGENKKALELLSIVTETKPDLPVGWESTARIAIAAKDQVKAADAIEKLKTLEGQSSLAQFLEGQLSELKGDKDAAIQLYQTVIKEAPTSPLAAHAMAALAETSDTTETLQATIDFLQSQPTQTPYSLTLLGECFQNLGNQEKAVAYFKQSIERNAPYQSPFINLAKILVQRHERGQAAELLQKAQSLVPTDLHAPMLRADILTEMKRYDEAIAIYQDILERNPKADIAANNMAQLIADHQSGNAEAMEKARIAAERFVSVSNPLLLDTLAWVTFKQNKLPQAQTLMDRIMTFGDKLPPQVHYHYGALLFKLGKINEAKAELEKAIAGSESYSGRDEAEKLNAMIK